MTQRLNAPRSVLTLATLAALVAAACGSGGQPAWTPLPQQPETPAPTSAASGEAGGETQAPGGETVQLTVGTDTGTELRFDPATVSAPAGSTIQLTFENRSTTPHNLTFDAPINQATAQVVNAGDSETLEFPAPDPGSYTFMCTLHPGMEGTLTIQ
ncbi:MAG TPA: cupredoxin domain-containing protein [Candidatus Binatia bacterium]|nr:cupredoxin domain-containing protein [Candidatus Binatia bacterium]